MLGSFAGDATRWLRADHPPPVQPNTGHRYFGGY
jgi:hypothetical protein